ncbi:septum formation protein Maf [Schaedlerella arabinosiphila]|uniref:dTTP/UTP pyrophosphatase n=1 Tax=Schaedlerella arabinosiphila TaxID=2044587 RepID=A0A3R8JQX7_9FIRM|nr:Maf family protein [Schaedlerella arabinosiphila]MCI9631718.1 septum formation protein Maf [Ruminococcus sp.]MDE7066982.1 Maf family protein [Schaedlerella arabinosiphila]RRK33238.1 septum formation protein Maf [Schaedlerella arabinosiphila]
MKKRIILGSASPRRKELLEQIGIKFEIVVSDAEEHYESTRPDEIVRELALMKAEQVAEEVKRREKEGVGEDYLLRSETGEARLRNLLILGADTVVVRDGEILGKPSGAEEAFEMLKSLQGRAHQVYTGVAVLDFDGNAERHTVSHAEETKVFVHAMTDEEIRSYIAAGESLDKAGAYGVQGRFAAYIDRIEGDYYNVVGLPVAYLYHAVKGRLEE